jgi:orotate phosphoribosyltransferase
MDMLSLSTQDIIRQAGGWHEGHFVFKDGYHGNGYLSKMTFLRYPAILEEMGNRLAHLFVELSDGIEVVVGPAMVGTLLAHSVAKRLGVPFTIIYRSKAGPTKFHRDFSPSAGASCLLVDDLAYSGFSLSEYSSFMISQKLRVVGAAVICSRVNNEVSSTLNLRSLFHSQFEKYEAAACPLCHQKLAIDAVNIKE